MKSFVFWVYKYILIKVSQFLLKKFALLTNDKIQQIIAEKNGELPSFTKQQANTVYWIHAASGEIEYARSLIREIKNKQVHTQIIVTYNSTSAKKTIQNMDEIDCYCMAPWEDSTKIQNFIQHFQPDILLIARTDAWPIMIDECSKQKIPIYLFSATLAEKSGRLRFPAVYLSQKSFEQMKKIYCVSQADKDLFQSISAKIQCEVLGDTRYDQVLFRLEQPKKMIHLKDNNKLTLVMGSTWPEDEAELLPCIAELIQKQELQLILAPHETNQSHLAKIEKLLDSLKLKSKKLSEITSKTESIVIIDQVGLLAEIYLQGDFAFVGGSFKKQVHSVMEPLAAGLITFVGPYFENNREAIEFSSYKLNEQFQIVNKINSGEEMKQKIQILLHHKNQLAESKYKIKNEILQKSGRTALLLSKIKNEI